MSDAIERLAIVGGGAMGSVFAAMFASAGFDVTIVSRPGAHLTAIGRSGLRLTGADGARLVKVRAVDHAPEGRFDLIVLAVKATQVAEALTGNGAMLAGETPVLAMQNGLGSADLIADALGSRSLAVGIASGFGASVVAPGHAAHTGMGPVRLGPYAELPPSTAEAIAAAWRRAGFDAQSTDDILAMQWEKLICNAAFSAACGLSGLTVGAALSDADLGPLCLRAGVEAWEIAQLRKVPLAITDPEQHIRNFASRVAAAKPSLLQDIEAGRPTEIEFINGAIPREAAKAGRTAPVNQTLTSLVRSAERRRSQ